MHTRTVTVTSALFLTALSVSAAVVPSNPPPPGVPVLANGFERADLVAVTLRPGFGLDAQNNRLTSASGAIPPDAAALLNHLAAAGATWERAYAQIPEAKLLEMHQNAVALWGPDAPDLRLQMTLRLPPTLSSDTVSAQLEQLVIVRRAQPHLTGAGGDPVPPNFTSNQIYLSPAPAGNGVREVHAWPNGNGAGIAVCDVERGFEQTHADLPRVTILGGANTDTSGSFSHGTAVLGIVISSDNGFGTTGGVFAAAPYFSHVSTGGTYDVARAIVAATAGLPRGAAMMIEQQIPSGPTGSPAPMEWRLDVWNAIRTATANGLIVVEAAANGGNDLDAAVWRTGNGGHYPFLPENDSGAIMVGAGAASTSATPRSRLSFSNFGSTVDVQGWGERVASLSYGDLYSAEGPNFSYTATFNGTSSATPVVTNAVVAVQAIYREVTSASASGPRFLTAAQMKDYLRRTGTPQPAPITQNIGPFPNAVAAITLALGELPGQINGGNCTPNNRPDAIDTYYWIRSNGTAPNSAPDRDRNLVPDSCEPPFCRADLDNGSGLSIPDRAVNIEDLLFFLSSYEAGDLRADLDDGSSTGTPSGSVEIADLLYFLIRYDQGC